MSFLYRHAITIIRKQPYVDWANSLDDGGPELTVDLAIDRATIYLVPELDESPNLDELLDEFWEGIFDEELAAWTPSEDRWPVPRTREVFGAWFEARLTESVLDLVPDEPLTEAEVDEADLDYAVRHCAWCGLEVEDGEGRFAGFKLADRNRWAYRAGLTFPLSVGDDQIAIGVMSLPESDAARAGDDIVFRACTSGCEKALRKAVPKALRQIHRR
jgi:hypothetical protein